MPPHETTEDQSKAPIWKYIAEIWLYMMVGLKTHHQYSIQLFPSSLDPGNHTQERYIYTSECEHGASTFISNIISTINILLDRYFFNFVFAHIHLNVVKFR